MRILGITLACFLGLLVVLSVAGVFCAILVPAMERRTEVVPGQMNVEWAPVTDNGMNTPVSSSPTGAENMPVTVEAVPGSAMPAPFVTRPGVAVSHARGSLALLPLIVLGLLVLGMIGLVVRLFRGNAHSGFRENPEEIRMMQEIHQGLSGLERRVESLETLLLDRTIIRDGEEWKKS